MNKKNESIDIPLILFVCILQVFVAYFFGDFIIEKMPYLTSVVNNYRHIAEWFLNFFQQKTI